MKKKEMSASTPSKSTPQSSWAERVSWGAGGFNDMLMNSVPALAMPIYSIAMGVNPSLIGLAVALPRVTDALTDPLMGNISDNARTRWGRRRPFIFIGALLMLFLYPLIWLAPRGLGETGLFTYFTVSLIIFYLANTIWNIPFQALGLELTDDYNERTTVQSMRSVFSNLMALGHGWLYPLCFVFSSDEVVGVRYVGLLIGIALFLFGVPSALFCRERKRVPGSKEKLPLVSSMTTVLRNRPFRLLCLALTVGACGGVMVSPMFMYTNIYYVFSGDKVAAGVLCATSGTISLVASLLFIPVGNWISRRIGKRRCALLMMSLIAVGKLSFWITQNPVHPYLQIISNVVYNPPLTVLWMLVSAMLADVCDYDELQTGRRREAIFGAVYQWVWKLGSSLAVVVSGMLLSLIGAKGQQTVLPDEVVSRMRLIFYILPAAFMLLGIVFMYFYPLTRRKMVEIAQQLNSARHLSETDSAAEIV